MGFYGNITNTSKTTFQFDKIYSNRAAMDAGLAKDGIMLGRYVLVEYDQNISQDMYTKGYEIGQRFYSTPTSSGATRFKYDAQLNGKQFDEEVRQENISSAKVGLGWIICDDNDSDGILKYYVCRGSDASGNAQFEIVENSTYTQNYQIDLKTYGEGRGYDSTVWMKTSVEVNNKLVTKYVQIAELNTVVPTFDIVHDAPTMIPLTPHFDTESTNVYYKLHLQPSWGLRVAAEADSNKSDAKTYWTRENYDVNTGNSTQQYWRPNPSGGGVWVDYTDETQIEKFDAAIYYNSRGFNPNIPNSKVDGIDNIEILPTGESGNLYTAHDAANSKKTEKDIQEIRINLPAIGNMMSEAWDIIHGPNRDDSKLETDKDGNRIDSLQGRLNSFYEMENDSVAVKRAEDGKMIGAKVNGGRTSEEDYTGVNDDNWIETTVNGNTNTFTIKHKFDEDKSNYQEINDKDNANDTESSINLNDNGGSDTFNINTPIVDSMGHTVGKNVETITLPFGFKTINVGNDTSESAAPAQTGVEEEMADNTQDNLTFTPTNKWIKTVATGNNEIKFGHELSGIEAKEHTSSDTDIANFGDTFNILKFTTDKAGHITEVGEESVQIPYIVFTNDTAGNVVTNMDYSYNTSNKTGTFTETRANVGALALGVYADTTTTTNDLSVLNTDTVSGAFYKVQTHINSLNLNPTENTRDWVTNVTQASGQIAFDKKGTDVLQLKNYSALTGVSSKDLSTNDTLNSAFGKLEYRIKEEEKNRADAIEALDVTDTVDATKYVSGVSETNGKISVSRAGTETLQLNGYNANKTDATKIWTGDTINDALHKVEGRLDVLQGGSAQVGSVAYQIAQIVNENNNGSIDTLNEIAGWIINDSTGAAKMVNDIATLKGNDTVSGSVANSIKIAIEGLDSSISVTAGKYISGITITDGKITDIEETIIPVREVKSGTANGTILVNGSAINVGGLKSAAYTESSAYAKADILDTALFDYGTTTEQKTIADLMDKVAELEAKLNELNNQINPPQEPDDGGETI